MKNHLQQYLYHLALILALAVGGFPGSAEVSAALPAAPEVKAETFYQRLTSFLIINPLFLQIKQNYNHEPRS